ADPHAAVAVGSLGDFVGADFHRFLDFRGVEFAPHQALDGVNGVGGVGDRLPFGDLPYEALALFGERNDRRRRPSAFFVGDDLRHAAFENGDARVRRAEVYADDFAHNLASYAKKTWKGTTGS